MPNAMMQLHSAALQRLWATAHVQCNANMLLSIVTAVVSLPQATGWLHKADVKTALAGFFKGKKVSYPLERAGTAPRVLPHVV
jgi:hypothetical protein